MTTEQSGAGTEQSGAGTEQSDTAGRTRVVIAEDEAIIRLDLKETLQDEGYLVVGDTGRGDIAVDMVRELKPDVAILDVKMPGIDGIEAARRINQEGDTAIVRAAVRPSMPGILMSRMARSGSSSRTSSIA